MYLFYCDKLNNYSKTPLFYTNIVLGEDLIMLYEGVRHYKKRDCFKYLQDFISGNYLGKVAILYGLRRTGKTTLLFQLLKDLPIDKTAHIKIRDKDNMSNLIKDLNVLKNLPDINISLSTKSPC